MKAFIRLCSVVLLASGLCSFASASTEKTEVKNKTKKTELLNNALKESFKERDKDQKNYRADTAELRAAEENARNEIRNIHVEIGDGLAGHGSNHSNAAALVI